MITKQSTSVKVIGMDRWRKGRHNNPVSLPTKYESRALHEREMFNQNETNGSDDKNSKLSCKRRDVVADPPEQRAHSLTAIGAFHNIWQMGREAKAISLLH
ncbi:hypothetical protein ANCCAN_12228 [Ancylostoma caninum]|uniref:Uncharacterized protein n=1 Tax=Ancylostoma caninum TaxID=29170 RepID=A0A368GFH9_ANCCA|nr:hypothetical protein ANCCAN_12228 [Ancylostoma caninum]